MNHCMKNKTLFVGVFAIAAAIMGISISTVIKENPGLIYGNAEDATYTLTLDASNKVTEGDILNSSYAAKTQNGNYIDFSLSDAVIDDNGFVGLNAGGYLANLYSDLDDSHNRISGIKTVTVNYSSEASLTLDYGFDENFEGGGTYYYDSLTLSSGTSIELLDTPSFIKISNSGDSTCIIDSIQITYSCAKADMPIADLTYEANETGYTVTGYNSILANGVVNIPSEYNGLPVTAIGKDAFFCCTSITSVYIPSSITSIGENAFCTCRNLKNVTFAPNSNLESIGMCGFSNCAFTSITIPASVTTLVENAFDESNSLLTVTFEAGSKLKEIGRLCFSYSHNLTSINIPSSVTSIEFGVFVECHALTIYCEAAEPESGVIEGWDTRWNSASCPVIWGTSYEDYSYNLLASSSGAVLTYEASDTGYSVTSCTSVPENGSVMIPFAYNGARVTSIAGNAFGSVYASLKAVYVPSSVTSIGASAFTLCDSLTSVFFVNNSQLESIGNGAFTGCSSLTSIELPTTLTSIGTHAFYGCSGLTSIYIPSSVTSIGSNAFANCSLTIYCEASTQPAGWDTNWNSGCEVKWGGSYEDYLAATLNA